MASSTPTSSSRQEQHNPHPYPIKTSHTGLLSRSNSTKAHGSWSKHHYTPVPPSPSAFVLDPSQSTPSPSRRHTRDGTTQGSEIISPSPSPSKDSTSWVGRNYEGEEVKLPRHPYRWTPAQLSIYLSSELNGSDSEPLGPDVVKDILDFIQQQKIGGRAFLNFEQEDFQEMEGIGPVWSNALWNASCALRQRATPHRSSRVSSSTYKRGRVRGVVNFFERSASESSDVGEDEPVRSPGKTALRAGPPTRKQSRPTTTENWDISESDDELGRLGLGPPQHSGVQEKSATSYNPELSLADKLSTMDEGPSKAPLSDDPRQNLQRYPTQPPAYDSTDDESLAVVIPPQSDTPVNLVLGADDFQRRNVCSPEPGLPDDHISDKTEEAKIISTHPREESEPTMAELYERTYGAQPPSPQKEYVVPRDSDGLSEDDILVATVTSATAAASSDPPTALRPVLQRKTSSLPRSLRHLFSPSPELQARNDSELQSVHGLPADASERDEGARRTIQALQERVAIVEQRLAAMEQKGSELLGSDVVAMERKGLEPTGSDVVAMERKELEPTGSDALLHTLKAGSRGSVSIENDLVDLDYRVYARSDETLRAKQSGYILLAGAMTGVSVMLIPLLFRHLWSR